MDALAELIIVLLVGSAIGAFACWGYYRAKLGSFEKIAKGILLKAETEAAAAKRANEISFKQIQIDQQRELELSWQAERKKNQREEERLQQREDKLEARLNLVETKLSDVERREAALAVRKEQLEESKRQLNEAHARALETLERCSGLSVSEAKEMLLNRVKSEVKTDVANFIRRCAKEAEEEAESGARKILATAINRLAVSCVSEATVNTITIPNDEMKGRIIGREGRNIRALEQATGVNFMMDDTPGTVVISGYDPVRVHIAKAALTELVADGRIYPTRIEEVVERARGSVNKQIKQFGEDAAWRAGIMTLHPEIITLLGKLKFRFSYGQNILEHSLEVCHLMGIMAAELGLDVNLAKRIGLLHDMGKAVTHEVEGTHAVIGHDIALKCGEKPEVANGIGCHHNEMSPTTIEGSLCSAADAISASRPGARVEAIEEYVKRLKKLEDIALEFPGVEKAYAMQAGREVRIMVKPEHIDDDALLAVARELTKRIEKELSYPGKIKVTAIREKRVIEYAM